LPACEFFGWKSADAKREACKMANIIADNWKQVLKLEGVTTNDIRGYASAFEHDEASETRSLEK